MRDTITSSDCIVVPQRLNMSSGNSSSAGLATFTAMACFSPAHTMQSGASTSKQPMDPEPFLQVLAILLCLTVVILFENGLVILAFSKDKNLRKRSANVLVFSQAAADIFTGLIFVPVYLVESFYDVQHVTPFLITYMLFISLFNLFALAFDRYLALRKPFLHHRIMDVKRTIKVLIFIWITPLLLTLIPLCWWFQPAKFQSIAFRIYLGLAWLLMLLLVAGMTVLYLFVTSAARKTIRNRRKTICLNKRERVKVTTLARKELRVAHLFGLLLFFFVLAYFPILYMNLCDIIGREDLIPEALQTTSFYFLLLNSVVNPLLCISLKRDYQAVIKTVVLCQKRPLHCSNGSHAHSYSSNIVPVDSVVDTQLCERGFVFPRSRCAQRPTLQLPVVYHEFSTNSEFDIEMSQLNCNLTDSPLETNYYRKPSTKLATRNIIAERERLLSILMENNNDEEEELSRETNAGKLLHAEASL